MIPVLQPPSSKKIKEEINKVLDSGWWGYGPKTKELEKKFADKVGIKHAIAVNSGTSALDLCLKVHNINGGELITTPMTFVSDAIVGEWNNMDVTFCDIDENSLCLDPKKLHITSATKAIIVVDSHGRLADYEKIKEKFGGLIIQDCAHAMLTPGAGQATDLAIWSFQAVKTLPAGDGGMITTNSDKIAKKLRTLTWLGVEKHTYDRTNKVKYSWDYDIKQANGVKAYMNDLTAIIALEQLKRIDEMCAKRRAIQTKYNNAFLSLKNKIEIPIYSHTCQYYTMKCEDRDKLSQYLADFGIATSVHFKPLSEMTYWKKAVKYPLEVTNKVWKRLLSLPIFYHLKWTEVEYIISKVREFYEYSNFL